MAYVELVGEDVGSSITSLQGAGVIVSSVP